MPEFKVVVREFTVEDRFKLADAQRYVLAQERNLAQLQAQTMQTQISLNTAKLNYEKAKNDILAETGGLILDETLEWKPEVKDADKGNDTSKPDG